MASLRNEFVACAVIAIAQGFALPAHAADKPDANKFKQDMDRVDAQVKAGLKSPS